MGFLHYLYAATSNHLSEKPKLCIVSYGRLTQVRLYMYSRFSFSKLCSLLIFSREKKMIEDERCKVCFSGFQFNLLRVFNPCQVEHVMSI